MNLTTGNILTSAVHDLPDHGGGHDVVGTEIVGQLASQRYDDGHHQVGQSGHHPNLRHNGSSAMSVYSAKPHTTDEGEIFPVL